LFGGFETSLRLADVYCQKEVIILLSTFYEQIL
jgi:hypothetical protein